MTVWLELQEKAMMDAKLPLTCGDLADFLSRSKKKQKKNSPCTEKWKGN